MTAQDHMGNTNYGIYPRERTAVFIHGPNFFNAHKALGAHSADLVMLRDFFEKYADLFGIHYFNVMPSDPDIPSPVDRICKFLECAGFPVYRKFVDMIPESAAPPAPLQMMPQRRENGFNTLSLAGTRPELYDTARDASYQPEVVFPERERMRMPRITLTAEIISQVLRVLLMSKARPHAAIQRVVFIGGEYDYPPFFDLLLELGVRLTLIGLNRDSVAPNNGFIPSYAMVPYSLKQGIPAQFVDLSLYMPFFKNEEVERRRAEGQGSGFSPHNPSRPQRVMVGGRA